MGVYRLGTPSLKRALIQSWREAVLHGGEEPGVFHSSNNGPGDWEFVGSAQVLAAAALEAIGKIRTAMLDTVFTTDALEHMQSIACCWTSAP